MTHRDLRPARLILLLLTLAVWLRLLTNGWELI